MDQATHNKIVSFIWGIADDVLRNLYSNLTQGKCLTIVGTEGFGQAFTLRSLYRAIQFCQGFTDKEIVSTLSTQLGWSHFIELLPIKDPLGPRFLRRDVSHRALGCAHPAAEFSRMDYREGGVMGTTQKGITDDPFV